MGHIRAGAHGQRRRKKLWKPPHPNTRVPTGDPQGVSSHSSVPRSPPTWCTSLTSSPSPTEDCALGATELVLGTLASTCVYPEFVSRRTFSPHLFNSVKWRVPGLLGDILWKEAAVPHGDRGKLLSLQGIAALELVMGARTPRRCLWKDRNEKQMVPSGCNKRPVTCCMSHFLQEPNDGRDYVSRRA